MIKKIISGGQTGADQAALDIAIELGIPYDGWIPKHRITEDGSLPDKYRLKEMPTISYQARTDKNIMESDATLIFSHGQLTGGSKYTLEMGLQYKRPCLHINLDEYNAFQATQEIHTWINEKKIEILNIAGPRASKDSKIYQAVKDIVKAVIKRLGICTTY